MVEYAAGRRAAVEFNTNGTLLDRSLATRLIDAGLYAITVSLDGATPETFAGIRGGSELAQVVGNVEILTSIKRTRGTRLPKIRFNVVVMKRNWLEIPDILHLARRLDVDTVILSPLQIADEVLEELACDAEEWRHLYRYVVLARKLGVGLYVYQPNTIRDRRPVTPERFPSSPSCGDADSTDGRQTLTKSVAGASGRGALDGGTGESRKAPRRRRRRPPCHYPWFTIYVTVDGYVMPCCWAQDSEHHHLGNVFEDDVATVWWGSRYRELRRQMVDSSVPLPAFCSSCPVGVLPGEAPAPRARARGPRTPGGHGRCRPEE
jgi:radical SAM protein with 4Fe4S-binding SPASM domain